MTDQRSALSAYRRRACHLHVAPREEEIDERDDGHKLITGQVIDPPIDVAVPSPRGTSASRPRQTHRRRRRHPRSTVLGRPLPRTAPDALDGRPAAAPAIAAGHATLDLPACVSLLPSQLPTLEVLRRPVEFTQYLAIRYTERLAEAEAVSSVGSKGDSYDNALAESVNGLYKAELINRHGPWRTVDEVELATAEWVHFWNTKRLHGACGDIPPVEFEAAYHSLRATTEAA